MADKLKIAFVGSGGIARTHAEALKKIDTARIAACVDLDPARADAFAAAYGATAYRTVDQMLDETKPDAAWVCVPPHGHGAELKLAARKVPFMVEKPINNDLAAARRIAAAVAKAGIVAGAAYMNRYRRGVQRVRELLGKDPPVLIHGGWIGGMPGVAWWRVRGESGGQILEQTTHTIDLVRYLGGDAVEVFAYPARGFIKGVPNYDVDDASTVAVHLKSGAVANLMSCCANRSGGAGVHLTVVARDLVAHFRQWNHDVEIVKSSIEKELIAGETNIFEIEDRAFLAAVQAKNPNGILCPYAEGLKTLELCLAANKSIATGKPVKLA